MKSLFIKYLVLSSFFSIAVGCGYHLSGTVNSLPPDIRKIAIPQFSNKTLRPDIENQFTSALLDEFVRSRKVEIVEEDRADALIIGVITSYTASPLSYTKGDVVQEYRVTVGLEVSLVRKTDESVIWKDRNVSYFAEYRSDTDTSVAESSRDETIKKIAVEVAKQLHSNILEGF